MQVETGAFNDCLLLGALGQLAFGSRLYSEASLQLSPILLAGTLPTHAVRLRCMTRFPCARC